MTSGVKANRRGVEVVSEDGLLLATPVPEGRRGAGGRNGEHSIGVGNCNSCA
jgi:hypothetical protein